MRTVGVGPFSQCIIDVIFFVIRRSLLHYASEVHEEYQGSNVLQPLINMRSDCFVPGLNLLRTGSVSTRCFCVCENTSLIEEALHRHRGAPVHGQHAPLIAAT